MTYNVQVLMSNGTWATVLGGTYTCKIGATFDLWFFQRYATGRQYRIQEVQCM